MHAHGSMVTSTNQQKNNYRKKLPLGFPTPSLPSWSLAVRQNSELLKVRSRPNGHIQPLPDIRSSPLPSLPSGNVPHADNRASIFARCGDKGLLHTVSPPKFHWPSKPCYINVSFPTVWCMPWEPWEHISQSDILKMLSSLWCVQHC